MGDVTGVGNTPTNQTSQSQAQPKTDAQAALFGEVLKQCPEGLHRPRPNDEPCTYLHPPSQPSESSQPSQPSQPFQLGKLWDFHNLKGPTYDPNSHDYKYNKSMPHGADPNPLAGAGDKLPDNVHYDSGVSGDANTIMIDVGSPPLKESPDQTPYKPPR